jgi:hypothetical protein
MDNGLAERAVAHLDGASSAYRAERNFGKHNEQVQRVVRNILDVIDFHKGLVHSSRSGYTLEWERMDSGERPKVEGLDEMLITVDYHGTREVYCGCTYKPSLDEFVLDRYAIYDGNIIAWAYPPKAYEPVKGSCSEIPNNSGEPVKEATT